MCLIKNIDSLQLHTSLNWFIMQINKLINNHLLDAGLPIGRISSLAFMHARDGYTLLIARFAIFLIADGSHNVGVCVFVGRVRRAIAVSKRIDSDVHKREKQTRVSIVCKPLRHASSSQHQHSRAPFNARRTVVLKMIQFDSWKNFATLTAATAARLHVRWLNILMEHGTISTSTKCTDKEVRVFNRMQSLLIGHQLRNRILNFSRLTIDDDSFRLRWHKALCVYTHILRRLDINITANLSALRTEHARNTFAVRGVETKNMYIHWLDID